MPDVPNRDEIERRLASRIGRAQSAALRQLMDYLGDPPKWENVPLEFWDGAGRELRGAVTPILEEVYLAQAQLLMEQVGIGVAWDLVNEAAVSWARSHAGELIRDVTSASQRFVQDAIGDYFEEGLTLGDLRERLMRRFGPLQADMIAQTEITRASVEGERATIHEIEKAGIRMTAIWQTNYDERVCQVCEPLNGEREAGRSGDRPFFMHPQMGQIGPPPAHPRCRCWLNHEVAK